MAKDKKVIEIKASFNEGSSGGGGSQDSSLGSGGTLDELLSKSKEELADFNKALLENLESSTKQEASIKQSKQTLEDFTEMMNLGKTAGTTFADLLSKSSEEVAAFNKTLVADINANTVLAATAKKADTVLEDVVESFEELDDNVEELSFDSMKLARNLSALLRSAGLLSTRQNQLVSTSFTLFKNFGRLGKTLLFFIKAVASLTLGTVVFNKAVSFLQEKIGKFSGENVETQAKGRIQALEDQIRLAQESGSGVADLGRIQNEIKSELRNMGRVLVRIVVPILRIFGTFFALILKVLNSTIVPILELMLDILQLILKVLEFIWEWILSIPLLGDLLQLAVDWFKRRQLEDAKEDSVRGNALLKKMFDPKNIGLNLKKP